MKKYIVLLLLVILAGCSSQSEQESYDEALKKALADPKILKQKKDIVLKWEADSIKREEGAKQRKIDDSTFLKTKAGKLWKKHPWWSKEDCKRLMDREIWVGMRLDQLKYLRGLPSSVNISNYGDGDRYQWCWDDYTPSCFYGKDDCIITSYN